ncbi:unnamed protein product [Ectocarpus fasciculatus]
MMAFAALLGFFTDPGVAIGRRCRGLWYFCSLLSWWSFRRRCRSWSMCEPSLMPLVPYRPAGRGCRRAAGEHFHGMENSMKTDLLELQSRLYWTFFEVDSLRVVSVFEFLLMHV